MLNQVAPYPTRIFRDSARLFCTRYINVSSIKFITVNSHLEVSEPNTMQTIVCVVTAVSCAGAAYLAHQLFPTKSISDDEILLAQSTQNTLNFLTMDALRNKPSRELIQLYLDKRANLSDIVMIITQTSSLEQAINKLNTSPPTPETLFLQKAVKDHLSPPVAV